MVDRWRTMQQGLRAGLIWLVCASLPALTAAQLACPGDCDRTHRVTIDELVRAVRIALEEESIDACDAADLDGDGSVRVDELVRAVASALNGCPPTPTVTATATASTATATPTTTGSPPVTATPSQTATTSPTTFAPTASPSFAATATATASATFSASATFNATQTPTATATATRTATVTPTQTSGLGVRRFSLAPSSSLFRTVLRGEVIAELTGFSGSLELAAGMPDPTTGLAPLTVSPASGASEFLSLDLGNTLLCIRVLPTSQGAVAGFIDCNGGTDLGTRTSQDHNVGVVGMGGFNTASCTAASGTVETMPHPNVCNGPIVVEPLLAGDSGAGAVVIGPDQMLGTEGLRAVVTFENNDGVCDGIGPEQSLGLITGPAQTRIVDIDNMSGEVLTHTAQGQAFSCAAWTVENGAGTLVLAFPTLHGLQNADIISVFVFDD